MTWESSGFKGPITELDSFTFWLLIFLGNFEQCSFKLRFGVYITNNNEYDQIVLFSFTNERDYKREEEQHSNLLLKKWYNMQ